MNLPNLRTKTLYVSSGVYSALKALADVDGIECPDIVAEAWLSERLEQDPRNARRQRLFADAMKEIDRKLRDEFDDKLP